MPNLWKQFADLLPDSPLLLGSVVSRNLDGSATIALLDGGTLRATGEASVGQRVLVRAGRIEEHAPDLPEIRIEI